MSDLIEDIADCLLEDHMELMKENAKFRHRIAELEAANAKMRKCLEAIALHHERQIVEIFPYTNSDELRLVEHAERRDFAREGLK